MFEKCNWTKYLIVIPKHNYQRNITCVALLIFFHHVTGFSMRDGRSPAPGPTPT